MKPIGKLFRSIVKKNKNVWKTDLVIILLFLVVFFLLSVIEPELPKEGDIRQAVSNFGSYGPVVAVGVVITETVIAPIPGTVFPIAAGVLYGLWPGLLYVWLGNVLGSCLAFWLAREFGRPLARRFINEKKIKKYDAFLGRNQLLVWLVFIMPLFPIDAIGYLLGLSRMKFQKFIIVVGAGFTVNLFALTYVGNNLLSSTIQEKAVYAGILLIVVLTAVTFEKIMLRIKQ